MRVLVTGGAGFIGSAVARTLLQQGERVVVLDNFNHYYDPKLKEDRLRTLLDGFDYSLVRADITDSSAIAAMFETHRCDVVCHLAAQAGVRASLEAPQYYSLVNVVGTTNLLEASRKAGVRRFIYASSSSVYGGNTKVPFAESDPVEQPISVYAATKRSTELLASCYHHLYGLPTVGLRYFTVYGPWGRPDMAYMMFTRSILAGQPIDVYNEGEMERDFTYVDDIVSGTIAALRSKVSGEIINLGNHRPVTLNTFIGTIERALGKQAERRLKPMPPGDVPKTYADITKAKTLLDWQPTTTLEQGIPKFVEWYQAYYRSS